MSMHFRCYLKGNAYKNCWEVENLDKKKVLPKKIRSKAGTDRRSIYKENIGYDQKIRSY